MSIDTRLKRLELSRFDEEMIVVNPKSFDGEPMPPEERERHRLAVLRVARNPLGILVCFMNEGEASDPLRELLGEADYATIAPHRTIPIKRSYGMA